MLGIAPWILLFDHLGVFLSQEYHGVSHHYRKSKEMKPERPLSFDVQLGRVCLSVIPENYQPAKKVTTYKYHDCVYI